MEVRNWIQGLGLVLQNNGSGSRRKRRSGTTSFPSVSSIDVLEDRLLLTSDFGDAPDTTAGTGVANYQTLAAHGGPSHVIDATQNTLYLGGGVDGRGARQ